MPLSNSNDVPPSTSLVFPSSKIVKLPKVLDGESFIVDFFNFELCLFLGLLRLTAVGQGLLRRAGGVLVHPGAPLLQPGGQLRQPLFTEGEGLAVVHLGQFLAEGTAPDRHRQFFPFLPFPGGLDMKAKQTAAPFPAVSVLKKHQRGQFNFPLHRALNLSVRPGAAANRAAFFQYSGKTPGRDFYE